MYVAKQISSRVHKSSIYAASYVAIIYELLVSLTFISHVTLSCIVEAYKMATYILNQYTL